MIYKIGFPPIFFLKKIKYSMVKMPCGKEKKVKQKISKMIMAFAMLFSLLADNITESNALATIHSYNANTEIPAEYATQFNGYERSDVRYSSHFITNPSGGLNSNISSEYYSKYVPESALSNSSNFGKIWWQYNNVLSYQGTKVHIRFTALSWNNTSLRYAYLGCRDNGGSLGGFYPRNTKIKIDFINASTGQPISIMANFTARDFDGASNDADIEKMTIHSGIDHVYLGEWMVSSGQTIYNGRGVSVTASEKEAWATLCVNGTNIQYTYTKGGFNGLNRGEGVAPIEKRYKITTKSTNATITASISEIVKGSNKTISWTAKDGYYISSVKVDGVSQSINSYRSGSYTFSNIQANHTIEVVATAQYHITTQGTNTTITNSIYNLDPNSSKTVSWNAKDGYWLSSVVVDGVSQSITSYRNGSYTFNKINENHDVKVISNPCYTITTEVVNGNITGNQTKIDPNENRRIDFSPKDGYYISEVIVDGHAYSYKDYASSYTFNKINANHHIKVVCNPLKTIITEIENGVITKTMTGLHPDDIKDIYFNAFYEYYIESVVVDGKNIPVDDFIEGNFEFDTVVTDHTVKVVCQPKPRIITEVVNGTITPEFTVFPHEDGKTIAEASDNYYISRILIDGHEIDDFSEYKNIYIFNDVTEDHYIYVECVPIPDLTIEKTTDKETYNYKDTVQYSITLEQTVENAVAYNVNLRDSNLTKGVDIDMNSLEVSGLNEDSYTLEKNSNDFELNIKELNYNQPVQVHFNAIISDKTLVNKNIENHVYATLDHFNEQVHDCVINKILKPQLSIKKTSDKNKYNLYDDIQYEINVKQTVNGAKAFNVHISDTFPSGVNIDMDSFVVDGLEENEYTLTKDKESFNLVIQELSDEQDVTVSYVGHIANPILAGKTITNTASVTSETNTSEVTSSVTNDIYKPRLVLSKISNRDYYNVEDEATFNISIAQFVEDAIAYNVVLKDNISEGVSIDWKSLQISGLNKDNYTLQKYSDKGGFELKIKELHSNDIVNITYSARINDNFLAGGEITNSVNVTCDNNKDIVKANVTKPVLKPELSIEKITDNTKYNIKDDIEFSLRVNQTVENAIANGVIVKDFDLSEGVLLDLDTIKVEGIDSTLYTVYKDKENNTFTIYINALAYNQEIIIKVKGKIIDPTLAGKTITNSASITSSNNDKAVTDKVTVDIYKPVLEIEKTSDKESYNYKDVVTYTLELQQKTENAVAYDVVVSDILPNGVELDMNSFAFKGIDEKDIKVEETKDGFLLKIPSLKDKVSITYKATINDPKLSGTDIKNIVSVTSSNNMNVIETEVVNKVLMPVFEIEKTSDKDFYNINDTIHYTVKTKQIVEGAKAYDVVLDDSHLNKGLKFKPETIKVTGLEEDTYEIEFKDQGYYLLHLYCMNDEEIQVEYDVDVIDPMLSGQKIEHEVYISCVNNPKVEEWKSIVENVVLQPQFIIEKIPSVERAKIGDKVHYDVTFTQTQENAKAFNVVLTDCLEDNQKLDFDSIIINAKNMNKDNYVIEKTNNGFMIHFKEIEGRQTINVEYDAIITDESKSISKNIAWIESASIDRVVAQTQIDIYKEPIKEPIAIKTNDKNDFDIFIGLLCISFIGFLFIKREEKY